MRAREFISESWWEGLDDDMLTIAGYAIGEYTPEEEDPNLEATIKAKLDAPPERIPAA